jgi:hypothetical protein
MTGPGAQPWTQLLVYRFEPGARFEGQFGGALQRIETGGGLRILDALFVGRDPDDGELVAINLKSDGAGGMVTPLVGFRLDPAERRRATQRALAPGGKGVPAETLQQLGDELERGAAIAALLVEHTWGRTVDEAVGRIGGAPIASGFLEAATLADLAAELTAAVSGTR